ncbi:MAG: hypothetical protein IJH90_08990 [Mogibacterium sp.]|nr:hypothetical protein [Mogibacterium sp.]
MANRYSKSNKSAKAQENKTMQEYEESRKRLNLGAKVMAIIIIIAMIVFYVISAGAALFD